MTNEKEERTEALGGKEWHPPGQTRTPTSTKLPPPDAGMADLLPPALRDAWIKYMISGYENNEKMFQRTLNAFMKPYYITVYMYIAIFIVGISFFVLATYLALFGDQPALAFGFGGLSVISFVAFFIRQPVQALEENLEFITWLGVAFNTYWTRLMYISNQESVQTELKAATDDYSDMVEKLIDKHATMRSKRAGSDLTEATIPDIETSGG